MCSFYLCTVKSLYMCSVYVLVSIICVMCRVYVCSAYLAPRIANQTPSVQLLL